MVTMLDYIKETPSRVLDIIDNSYEYTKDLVNFYIENKYDGLYFVASGSSYNGSLCAKAFMQHIFGQDIKLSTPFSFSKSHYPLIILSAADSCSSLSDKRILSYIFS